jgi:hypothetical protein
MEAVIAALVTALLLLGPLGWRVWADRKRAEADLVAAEVRAATRRRLRGDSYLAVRVTPPGLARAGRVVLSTPAGHGWLVERVWSAVAERVPAGYELVIHATPSRLPGRGRPLDPPGSAGDAREGGEARATRGPGSLAA